MIRYELWARPRDEERDLPYIRVGLLDLPAAPSSATLRRWNADIEFIYGWTGVEYALRQGRELKVQNRERKGL